MRRLATVTSVLLAMAGMAGAQPYNRPVPVNPGQHQPYDRGVDEGARRGDYGARPYYDNGLVPLVSDVAVTRPRMFIPLSVQLPRFQRLRIERRSGLPYIRGVDIEFMDGEHQFVRLDRQLVPGSGVVYIDLNNGPRQMRRIVVDAQPDPRASFALMGV